MNHHPNNCELNADLVLKMSAAGESLTKIAATVKTNRRHVKTFLQKNGAMRHFPYCKPGAEHYNWKGGRTTGPNGCVRVLSKDHPHASKYTGYVLEHRLVMEKNIGRILDPEEVVHHKNGDPSDNRIENLTLFRNNGEHLAETIKGQCPKWSEDGIRRMKEGIARSAKIRRPDTHIQSGLDVRSWP